MLELKNITKEYESGAREKAVRVLKGISLDVGKGQGLAIVGPSGCGKSTLLNIAGGLDRPTAGEVLLDGQDLSKLNDTELAKVRNREIGFIFQLHHLLPQCTVLENVLLPTLAYKSDANKDKLEERATRLLERVGLKDWAGHRPGELSGGERQRVAVIRALINEPKLLLADEPTGALDKEAADNVFDLLTELNKSEGVTLIAVTHSMRLAERLELVLELNNGQLVREGT
jgi:ABC-type lipoprotein export system ATPase subunit